MKFCGKSLIELSLFDLVLFVKGIVSLRKLFYKVLKFEIHEKPLFYIKTILKLTNDKKYIHSIFPTAFFVKVLNTFISHRQFEF